MAAPHEELRRNHVKALESISQLTKENVRALQRVEACRLLVAAGAWCVAKNVGGWYATQEACRLDDAPLLESMVRSAMRHAFSKFEEKLPRLQAALVALPDFELELHWQFSSWIPFAVSYTHLTLPTKA